MARGAEFHEGVQGDLFLDHFQGAVGTERVGLDSDSTGRLIFLSHDTPSDGADVTAYKQGQEGYEDIGYLAARRARHPEADPTRGGHKVMEISDLTVDHPERGRGVADTLYHFGRQFDDIRHSPARTDSGDSWAKKVGGTDIFGRDVHSYRPRRP